MRDVRSAAARSAAQAPPSPQLIDAITAALGACPDHEQTHFLIRVRRWWPDLMSALAELYPDPAAVAGRAVVSAARYFAARDDDLKLRDLHRILQPDWFQQPDAVGYAAYTDRFAGPQGLLAVPETLGHLKDLGVTFLHLMPLLRPRPTPSDGGYAVADYREIRDDLGTIADLRALTRQLHAAGVSLCLDLVLNHVAREHEWAQRARAGEQRYRDYFFMYPDRAEPDAFEVTLPEVFPDFAPGNFSWDDEAGGWVWTTFNSYQWDLAWSNPDVFVDMLEVVLFLANQGVDVLRLDAIAFTWKRKGTNSQNQPEVHSLTQALHSLVRMACPTVAFLAEAIVAPSDLAAYLGQAHHYGKVSDLAYNNSLMVQIWSMLASRDVRLAVQALRTIPAIPPSTTWLTYLRCHDDIGWAVEDRDASAVGLSGPEHRAFLSDFYSGLFPGSFAEGLVFQFNPDTGDRRISGATASLAGLGTALAGGDPEAVRDAVARILLAHAIIMLWGGIPVLWSGDEIGTLNDEYWAQEPAHADDNRWAHRPRLDWYLVGQLTAQDTDDDQGYPGACLTRNWPSRPVDYPTAAAMVFDGLKRLIRTRVSMPQLHASVAAEAISTSDPGVLAVRRPHPLGTVVGLFNVTESPRIVPLGWLQSRGVCMDN